MARNPCCSFECVSRPPNNSENGVEIPLDTLDTCSAIAVPVGTTQFITIINPAHLAASNPYLQFVPTRLRTINGWGQDVRFCNRPIHLANPEIFTKYARIVHILFTVIHFSRFGPLLQDS